MAAGDADAEQEAVLAMQAPAHSFIPVGQVPPHEVPSQVAVPPVGIGQATHAVPQFATSVFFTQVPVQSGEPIVTAVAAARVAGVAASLAQSVPRSTMTWRAGAAPRPATVRCRQRRADAAAHAEVPPSPPVADARDRRWSAPDPSADDENRHRNHEFRRVERSSCPRVSSNLREHAPKAMSRARAHARFHADRGEPPLLSTTLRRNADLPLLTNRDPINSRGSIAIDGMPHRGSVRSVASVLTSRRF